MTSSPAAPPDGICPSCSAPISVNPRFSAWCPACDWNVDPLKESAAPQGGRWQRKWRARRRAADRAAIERLFTEVSAVPDATGGRDGAGIIAMVIAGAVHLSTVALAAGSVWLLINGAFAGRILGVMGLAIAFLLRPRLGWFRQDMWSLSRTEAPHLYGLADRVAAELGVAPPDLIRVTPDFNASFGKVGLRRRSVLTIGLAVWEVLTPQERVALLGHEFGHSRNGDSRRGVLLQAALEALGHWYAMTHPRRILAGGSGPLSTIAAMIAAALLLVPNILTALTLFALHRLTLRNGQRAEYLADDLAAQVASSAAARSMLEALVLAESVKTVLQRQTARHQMGGFQRANGQEADYDLWRELRDHIATVPETERLRRLRISALRMSSVDTTHPPTHLRIQMMAVRKPRQAAITLREPETDAITAELSGARSQAAQAVLTLSY
ncbi:M48 family metallopeptidase [Sphaerimonospora thailandensis]|uniref:Peptidase M48 domain-containing protein n=1 Tax=Sphaerimonospora thailandensis TaxID=795644 RepID=A0A8J3RD75_9ACTN|nr:M48 family metallopeptidase [Sphaerimonospora thailandensis]GIH72465.1 hypothetical protein Mth01_47180 [Sphaerimonospora thailandensis]